MSNFAKKARQRIIDGYLAETGRNMFVASEFVDWLKDQQDNEAYPLFYGTDDATAARAYRIDQARRMASGLRIVATSSAQVADVVQVSVREYPAYLSPVSGRKSGGGYQRMDPEDAEMIAELRKQGAMALRSWLERYRGVFVDIADLSPLEEIVDYAAELDKVG